MSFQQQQHQQHQLLMRLPDDMAAKFRSALREFENSALNKTQGTNKEDIKNPIDAVEFRPADPSNPSNDFIFSFDGQEFPALLINLPTLMESHKTFNNKIFLKSGDIGQMLQVFRDEKERSQAKAKFVEGALGETAPSGICPPTRDIVRRRFARTHQAQSFMPFKVRQVVDEILSGKHIPGEQPPPQVPKQGLIQGQPKKKGGKKAAALATSSTATASEEASQPKAAEFTIETVVEEVVDFQDWMVDDTHPGGVSVTMDGLNWDEAQLRLLLQHPEALLTGLDLEDDELEHAYALAVQETKKNIASNNVKEKGKGSAKKAAVVAAAAAEAATESQGVALTQAGSTSPSSSSLRDIIPENLEDFPVTAASSALHVDDQAKDDQLLASLMEQIGDLDDDDCDDDDDDGDGDGRNNDIMVVAEVDEGTGKGVVVAEQGNVEVEEDVDIDDDDDDDDDDAWMKELESPTGKDS